MNLFELLGTLTTESINERTAEIDLASTRDVVRMLHEEDSSIADAVGLELGSISSAVDAAVAAFSAGGRLIYVGAGTSGRLGVLDASECPPTFGTDPAMVQGVIAGGHQAMFRSVEGAEDDPEAGALALKDLSALSGGFRAAAAPDVVCGLSASGRTPFVIGALKFAHEQGCTTILVSTNPREVVQANAPFVNIFVCVVVGAEPIAGSTRMKSGTAQKMVLNMITTGGMVRLGKTYGNVMVDLRLSNEKLQQRAIRIVMALANVDRASAESLLEQADGHVKTALVMSMSSVPKDEAARRLLDANGLIRKAIL